MRTCWAERYEDAAAKYREALAGGDDEALAHKLQRAEAGAASLLSRGEQQASIFQERLSSVAEGGLLVPAPGAAAAAAVDTAAHRRTSSHSRGRGAGDRLRGLGDLPSVDQAGRTSRSQRRHLDQLVLGGREAPRPPAEVVPDPQARTHARDPVREQPGPALPRGCEDRLLRGRSGASGVGAPLAQRRRLLEQPRQGRGRPARPYGRRRLHTVLPQRRGRPGTGRHQAGRAPGDGAGERA